jgi:hypothetical protein
MKLILSNSKDSKATVEVVVNGTLIDEECPVHKVYSILAHVVADNRKFDLYWDEDCRTVYISTSC